MNGWCGHVDIDTAGRHAQRWRQGVPNLCTVVEYASCPGCARAGTGQRDARSRHSGVSSPRVCAAERLPPCRFRAFRRVCAAGEAKITPAVKVAAVVLNPRLRRRVAVTLQCLVIPDLVMTHACARTVQLGARRVKYAVNKPEVAFCSSTVQLSPTPALNMQLGRPAEEHRLIYVGATANRSEKVCTATKRIKRDLRIRGRVRKSTPRIRGRGARCELAGTVKNHALTRVNWRAALYA